MMERAVAMLLIGLFFGGGAGFLAAASANMTLDGHEHAAHASTDNAGAGEGKPHAHGETLSLPSGPQAPTLEISVERDPVAGWNLHVNTTGFRFAPENASRAHVDGEGHAHVYVGDRKIARLYSSWMHIDELPMGGSTVSVTLNSNDHRMLAVDGEPLKASVTVEAQ